MASTVLGTAFACCIGAMFVASRFLSWLTLLHGRVKAESDPSSAGLLASWLALVLHSGPWSLAIGTAALWYVWWTSNDSIRYAALTGLALALAIIGVPIAFAMWRVRHPVVVVPLTPERLAEIRARFFYGNGTCFAVVLGAALVYMAPEFPNGTREFAALVGVVSGFCTGWVWSWFMWQWYGEVLKLREARRMKREMANEV